MNFKKILCVILLPLLFLTGCKTTIENVIDLDSVTFKDNTFTYDGEEKKLEVENISNSVDVVYENNNQISVGEYIVKANLYVEEVLQKTLTATLTINKGEYSLISFEDKSFYYDGTEKNLSVNYDYLPEGTEITYENNNQISVGEYIVKATISHIDGFFETMVLEAKLTIYESDFDLGDISFKDQTFIYDNNEKSIYVIYTNSNITIEYENNNQTEIGEYKVSAKIYYKNEYQSTLTATLTIVGMSFDVVLNGKSVTYDSNVHSLEVEGIIPGGTNIVYENNDQSEIGEYIVKATISNELYITKILEAKLIITDAEIDITGISLEGKSYKYDSEEKSLKVDGLSSDLTVVYENNNQTDVGIYEVAANIYKNDTLVLILYANLIITAVISEGGLSHVSLNEKTFVYDNTSKYLSVIGELPFGIQVIYENNNHTEIGIYEVTATLICLSNSLDPIVLKGKLTIVSRDSVIQNLGDLNDDLELDDNWSINSSSSITNVDGEYILNVSNASSGISNNYTFDNSYDISNSIFKFSFSFFAEDISILSGGLKLYEDGSEFARLKFETSRVRMSSTSTSTYTNYTPDSFKSNEWINFDVLVFQEYGNTVWKLYINDKLISDTISFGKTINGINKVNFFADSMKNDVYYTFSVKNINASLYNIDMLDDLEVGTVPNEPSNPVIPGGSEDQNDQIEPDTGNVISVSTIAELKTALSSVKAGETILLEDGIYNNLGDYTIQKLSATADERITIRARNIGEVSFTGTASIEIKSDYVTVAGISFLDGCVVKRDSSDLANVDDQNASHVFKLSSNYARISNILIDGFDDAYTKTTYITVTNEALYNEIDHCDFINKASAGVLILVERDTAGKENGLMYTHIHNNYFADYINPYPDILTNGLETIRIGSSTVSQWYGAVLIEDNIFEGISGEAELISVKSCGNIIRRNVLINCDSAITLRHGHSNIVDSNIVLNDGISDGNGIRAFDYNHVITNNYISGITSGSGYDGGIILHNGTENPALNGAWTANNILIENNTIVNSRQNIALGDNKYDIRPYDITLKNNFVYNISTNGTNFAVRFNASNGTGTVTAEFINEWYYSSRTSWYTTGCDSFVDLTETSVKFNMDESYISEEDASSYILDAGTSVYYFHTEAGASNLVFLTPNEVGVSENYYVSRNISKDSFNSNFVDWKMSKPSDWPY